MVTPMLPQLPPLLRTQTLQERAQATKGTQHQRRSTSRTVGDGEEEEGDDENQKVQCISYCARQVVLLSVMERRVKVS
jgi:hypothetical protein